MWGASGRGEVGAEGGRGSSGISSGFFGGGSEGVGTGMRVWLEDGEGKQTLRAETGAGEGRAEEGQGQGLGKPVGAEAGARGVEGGQGSLLMGFGGKGASFGSTSDFHLASPKALSPQPPLSPSPPLPPPPGQRVHISIRDTGTWVEHLYMAVLAYIFTCIGFTIASFPSPVSPTDAHAGCHRSNVTVRCTKILLALGCMSAGSSMTHFCCVNVFNVLMFAT